MPWKRMKRSYTMQFMGFSQISQLFGEPYRILEERAPKNPTYVDCCHGFTRKNHPPAASPPSCIPK